MCNLTNAPEVSLVCPVLNAGDVLPVAMASWKAQTVPLEEIIIVDDGSSDESSKIAHELGGRVIRFEVNRGRGAARAVGTLAASGQYLLFADAHNTIEPEFVENALLQFTRPEVVGVVGYWYDPNPQGVLNRWRARHLFRCERGNRQSVMGKTLATHACLLLRSAVLEAGNFDENFRQDEDTELGERMTKGKHGIVQSRDCRTRPLRANSWGELVERHTRWYVRANECFSVGWYVRWLAYSVKVMVIKDLRARDPMAGLFSLLLPHAMAWRLIRRSNKS